MAWYPPSSGTPFYQDEASVSRQSEHREYLGPLPLQYPNSHSQWEISSITAMVTVISINIIMNKDTTNSDMKIVLGTKHTINNNIPFNNMTSITSNNMKIVLGAKRTISNSIPFNSMTSITSNNMKIILGAKHIISSSNVLLNNMIDLKFTSSQPSEHSPQGLTSTS
ncbi:hypothetical protein BGZ58_009329 [Dissophora ornata]|nr:hypothetical protein BGZ58_009329 [Dissophora ornata]